jgi:putative lipoprotein
MKQILPLFLLITLLNCFVSCKTNKETPTEAYTEMDTTSIDTTETDAIEETLEVTPPKKADEFFDDFLYAFMKQKRFQRNRISFPLRHFLDGEEHLITRRAWGYDPMFSKRETYTLIFDSRKGMKLAKDTSICHVIVEELNLAEQRVKCYHFDREQAEWRLTQLVEDEMQQSENSGFYTFYQQFAANKEFRRSHITSPLAFSTIDEDTFDPIDGVITPEQWEDFGPQLPTTQITNILYGQTYLNSNVRLLTLSSISGGMNCTLTFKKQKGEWMLVKLEN